MKALEYEVLSRAKHWFDSGQTVFLCTIVKAVGSSPRPVGSLLACTDQGEQIGSLSGGCVEEDLLEKICNGEISSKRLQLVEYGVSAEENERLGLPCGGRLHVLVQRIENTSEWLDKTLDALRMRSCVRRSVDL